MVSIKKNTQTINNKNTMSTVKTNKKQTKPTYSSFWLDNFFDSDYISVFDTDAGNTREAAKKIRLFRLIEHQRVISNFVRIFTQRNDITVKFNHTNSKDSYTNGKHVVLSAKISSDTFDSAVGLALHEAAHILYTDFTVLNDKFENTLPIKYNDHLDYIFRLFNIIEDLFVNTKIYEVAPGYRGYCKAFIDEYYTKDSHKSAFLRAEASKLYNSVTWDAYTFHLFNALYANRNVSILPDFNKILDLIDVKNISRLTTTEARLELAEEVGELIIKNISDYTLDTDSPLTDVEEFIESYHAAMQNLQDLPEQPRRKIETWLNDVLDTLAGKTKKKPVTIKESKLIDQLVESQSELSIVAEADNTTHTDGYRCVGGIPVIVVNNVTYDSIECGAMADYGLIETSKNYYRDEFEKHVANGIINGKALAKKIQIRNEERITQTTRLKNGKIDRRLLSELSFDNVEIFKRLEIKSFKPVHIHVSVDQSGSMSHNDRLKKSMELAACLASASLLIRNLHVTVSIRSTTNEDLPYICYIFDSKKHTMNDIFDIFSSVMCYNETPESLCFEAIHAKIQQDAKQNESYFINICDGLPTASFRNYESYTGYKARHHCREQMEKIERQGTKFLVYFIGDSNSYGGNSISSCYPNHVTYLNSPSDLQKIADSLKSSLIY